MTLTASERDAIAADLKAIAQQERELVFDHFDEAVAWELGSSLRSAALSDDLPIVVDIRCHDRILFAAALPGSTADNWHWVRRKSALVHRVQRSSYAVGLNLSLRGRSLGGDSGLDDASFAAHGGGFPLRVRAFGFVGCLTISGLPQRDDHEMGARGIAAILGKDEAALALPER
jgi:uncharacterized protein (UPF0303 family)